MVIPSRSKPTCPGASMKALGVSMGPVWAETVVPIRARRAKGAKRRRENKGVFLRSGFSRNGFSGTALRILQSRLNERPDSGAKACGGPVSPGRYTRDLEHIQGGSETDSLLEPAAEDCGPPPHPVEPRPGGPVRLHPVGVRQEQRPRRRPSPGGKEPGSHEGL